MRILLVGMPWAALGTPSLALGILRRVALDALPGARVETLYANLAFADWLAERTTVTAQDYARVGDELYFTGIGDWMFSSALYGDPYWREQEFLEQRAALLPPAQVAQAVQVRRLTPQFIDGLAEQIVGDGFDLVGFTSTFQQTAAVLALARRIKQ